LDKQAVTLSAKEKIGFRPIADSEPEWLYRLRLNAWKYSQESALPDRATHLWRYTDPAIFEVEGLIGFMNKLSIADDNGNGNDATNRFEDRLDTDVNIDRLREKGVILKELSLAVRENPDLILEYLDSLAKSGPGRFEALNTALWNRGRFLFIPDNAVLEEPIYIRNQISDIISVHRNLIVIGDNSQVTIVDDYRSGPANDKGNANCAIELVAGSGSNITYVNLYRPLENVTGLLSFRARIGQDSSIHSLFGGFGGLVTKVNAGVQLAGRGANSRMDGLVFARDRQRFDYHTRQHHSASESLSDIDFRVILRDKANSAYTGLIRIEKDALNCEAYQENRNLLLNNGARAESIPELEILTDQVRCTHGATMGPIDPEMIFYLRSRGFDVAEATKAIVEGFVKSILDRIPEKIEVMISKIVSENLGGRSGE